MRLPIRQHDLDASATPQPAHQTDGPSVRLGDRLADRQPQPCSSSVAAAPGVYSVEAVENPVLVLSGDPIAGIPDPEPDRTIVWPAASDDRSPRRGMGHRVVDQIDQQLHEQIFVGDKGC